jgi:putative acetyltransferase
MDDTQMRIEVHIRKAQPEDVDAIRFLFRDTVTFINAKDYTQEEIRVWANNYKNTDRWIKHILHQYFIVAMLNDQIIGFCSMENDGYLDFMYIHKDFQKSGVAKKLLTNIEDHARKSSVKKIYSHVSKTARPFFEKQGYTKTGEQINRVSTIEFVNSIMTKII